VTAAATPADDLARERGAGHTVPVSWGTEAVSRAPLFRALLSRAPLFRALALRVLVLVSALGVLGAVLPADGAGSATAVGAALALALASSLLLPAPRCTLPAPGSSRSPDAPGPDERCRRGVFRRQTSPDAPGRVRPRAPQPA
jgi:hypothetical protein